jgi:chromosomal replication initiation ATPase DnaA
MVCKFFGVTADELKSKGRTRRLFVARCAYTYLMRHHVGDSYVQIGYDLNRDHCTAMWQLERMNELIFTKDPAAETMKSIEWQLIQLSKPQGSAHSFTEGMDI